MALDLELLKKHPYATGGVVIVGGLVVFYLLSSSQASSSAATTAATPAAPGTSDADYQAALAANSQLAQVQAAAQVQTNAQQVQLQQAQLEADSTNQQTAAALATTNVQTAAQLAATLAQVSASVQENQTNVEAATADTANQYVYAENLQSMQDQVLTSQINSGVLENANNNATALAGLESTNELQANIAGLQAGVASQGITAAETVQQQAESDQFGLDTQTLNMVQQAGLNHGTESLENDLTGIVSSVTTGSPATGTAAVSGNASAAAASSAATASIINTITGTAGKVASGLLAA
jgi:hypothetical protein